MRKNTTTALGTVALIGLVLSARGGLDQDAAVQRAIPGIHMEFRMRTPPNDNFSQIAPDADFVRMDLWKEFAEDGRWRIEKPGRVAVADGHSTTLFIKPINLAVKIPESVQGAFDTQSLLDMADCTRSPEAAMEYARKYQWSAEQTREKDARGIMRSVVTMEVKSNLAEDDYLRNEFFATADARYVYRFEEHTGRFLSLKVYLKEKNQDVLILECVKVESAEVAASDVYHLDLPSDVTWHDPFREQEQSETGARHNAVSAEEAAEAFLQACARSDWQEVDQFLRFPSDHLHKSFGGLEVIHIGQGFASAVMSAEARRVPCEVKLRNGEVRKLDLVLKKNPRSGCWFVKGGI